MQRRLALFACQCLNFAVTAYSYLQHARCGTSVAVPSVSIVAFLASVRHSVPAKRSGGYKRGFQTAVCAAAVTAYKIPVVALFGAGHSSVTATGR